MKKALVTLLCVFMGISCFAQSLEQSFTGLMNEYKKSPQEYSQNYYPTDYRFLGHPSGKILSKKEMNLTNLKVSDMNWTDLKFYESGDLGIVSGIITIQYNINSYKDAFTYTFQKQKGKWMHVMAHHTKIEYNEPNKEATNLAKFKTYFEEARVRFMENAVKSMNEEFTSDFQYITSQGVAVSLKQIEEIFSTKKVLQRDITDLVFRPYGEDIMIVTGKMTHKYLQLKDNSTMDYGTEGITYTYIKDKNAWKLASAHHSKDLSKK